MYKNHIAILEKALELLWDGVRDCRWLCSETFSCYAVSVAAVAIGLEYDGLEATDIREKISCCILHCYTLDLWLEITRSNIEYSQIEKQDERRALLNRILLHYQEKQFNYENNITEGGQ